MTMAKPGKTAMKNDYTLLPPNSTPFERRAEQATRYSELTEAIDEITGVKWEIPGTFAPWLAAEWFLSDFAPYFDDARGLIAAGLPWLRMRGTAEAVRRALSWIAYSATIEEDGARLHLDPGSPTAPARLADIKLLVGRSIPAHVSFYRMYHGYDIRHLRLDRSRLDDAMLDDDSGLIVDDIKLSFASRHAASLPLDDEPLRHASLPVYSTLLWDDDSWRLDAWRLDSEIVIDSTGRMISVTCQVLDEPDDEPVIVSPYDVLGSETIIDDLDDTPLAKRSDFAAFALPDFARRRWTGPWSEPWREAIPSRFTEES